VVVGGGSVGCETAEFLAQSAKEVTLVEMLNKIGMDMSPMMIPYFMEKVDKYGIKVMTNYRVEEITENGITTVDKNQQKQTVECDTVVIAGGAKPNNKLAQELQGKGIVVYSVGDCAQDPPRKLIDAIHEDYFTALTI